MILNVEQINYKIQTSIHNNNKFNSLLKTILNIYFTLSARKNTKI